MDMLNEPRERPRSFARRDAGKLAVAALLLLAILAAGAAIDFGPTRPSYTVNTIATTAIRAPHPDLIPNSVETKQAQDAARAAVPPRYDYTVERAATIADGQVAALRADLGAVDGAFDPSKAPEARRILLQTALPSLTSDAREILVALPSARWPVVKQAAVELLGNAERDPIRDTDLAASRSTLAAQYMPTGLSSSEQRLVTAIVSPLFLANSSYSEQLTQQDRDKAAANVATVVDTVQTGQVIVDAGHPISESDMVKIRYLGLVTSQMDWGKVGAWMLLNVLVAALLLAWIWRFRPEFWHRNRTMLLIGLIFAVTVLALKVPAGRPTLPFFIPTAAAGMLLTVLLDSSIGMVMMAVVAVVAGMVNGVSLEVTSYVICGGLAGILAIRKGDRLQYFIQAALAIAVTDMVVVSTFLLLGQHDPMGLFQLWGASAAAAVLAGIITIGSFAALGNVFGILTGFQLLELANPSQPLLRRLLTETPGTYHHALMVGNLAERAAASIGADPLLTRVAAYYHDVGKLANPLAFIENQAGAENVHDGLDPHDSAAILKQHVPDGIDLAYKAKLPKPLIAFIPQHHGTALLSYFYAKARDEAAAPFGGQETAAGKAAADAVDQRRFRHGGPKPQSREAALLMLADGVEASVRSLASRDEATIRAMVSRIIEERLQDGQLNECELTIRDLETAREAFVRQLLGMYHQRIAYPQNKIVELETRRERGLG